MDDPLIPLVTRYAGVNFKNTSISQGAKPRSRQMLLLQSLCKNRTDTHRTGGIRCEAVSMSIKTQYYNFRMTYGDRCALNALVTCDAGVNFKDIYIRQGDYPGPFPMSLGIEGSGVVAERGAEVKDVEVGDAVAYMGIPVRVVLPRVS